MWVHGVELLKVQGVERGASGVRVTFKDGERKFISAEEGAGEIWDAWRLVLELAGKGNAE
jgi:hypothetical protein